MDYLSKFHAELDRNSELETATRKGLKQGREEGLAEGEAKGKAEDREKPRMSEFSEFRDLGLQHV